MTDQKLLESPEVKLTIKQRQFLKLYFQTGNGVQSAMKTYDTNDYQSAAAIASENLKKLKEPIRGLMEMKGLSLGDLIDTVRDARNAMRKRAEITDRDNKGRPVYEYFDEPDHIVRLKSVEIASKWLGIESDVKPAVSVQVNTQVNLDKYLEDV